MPRLFDGVRMNGFVCVFNTRRRFNNVFFIERNGYQLKDDEAGPTQRVQMLSGRGGSPTPFGSSHAPHGPLTFHESSFYHYP